MLALYAFLKAAQQYLSWPFAKYYVCAQCASGWAAAAAAPASSCLFATFVSCCQLLMMWELVATVLKLQQQRKKTACVSYSALPAASTARGV